MDKDLIEAIFAEPKLIAVVGDPNSGKSNLIYHLIDELQQLGEFSLYTYGLRVGIPKATQIYSVIELEQIRNSIIILDEVMTLWDLDDRKNKTLVENSLRLIHHNNNILVISVLPENLKKFVSSKVNLHIFKRCTIPDFINGSVTKRIADNYAGPERGSIVLNIPQDEGLLYLVHFHKFTIPYMKDYDTKASNKPIINLSQKTSEKTSQKTSTKTSEDTKTRVKTLKFANAD